MHPWSVCFSFFVFLFVLALGWPFRPVFTLLLSYPPCLLFPYTQTQFYSTEDSKTTRLLFLFIFSHARLRPHLPLTITPCPMHLSTTPSLLPLLSLHLTLPPSRSPALIRLPRRPANLGIPQQQQQRADQRNEMRQQDVGIRLNHKNVHRLHGRGGNRSATRRRIDDQRRKPLLRQHTCHEVPHELLCANQSGQEAEEVDKDGRADDAANHREGRRRLKDRTSDAFSDAREAPGPKDGDGAQA